MKALFPLTLGLAIAAAPAAGLAQDYIAQLDGTWNAVDGSVMLWNGKVNTYPDDYEINQLVISDQQGSVFKATQTIKAKSGVAQGAHGSAPLDGQSTEMIGAVDGTGPFVVLVDLKDSTVVRCSLEDEDTMRCLVAEPGEHAIAGFAVLKRAK